MIDAARAAAANPRHISPSTMIPSITRFAILLLLSGRGSRPGPVVILEVVVVKISAGVAQGSELLKGGFALAEPINFVPACSDVHADKC